MTCIHCGGEIYRAGQWWRHKHSRAMGCTGLDTFAEPSNGSEPVSDPQSLAVDHLHTTDPTGAGGQDD